MLRSASSTPRSRSVSRERSIEEPRPYRAPRVGPSRAPHRFVMKTVAWNNVAATWAWAWWWTVLNACHDTTSPPEATLVVSGSDDES